MPLAIGQIMHNRYRVLGPLGQGGMGAVYLAEDLVLGRRCALKENIPDPNASPQVLAQMRQQFQAEARVLARLDHPNLPKVYDYFSAWANEYIVMEYVDGENLASILNRHRGPLPEQVVLAWARQILDALAYLHSQHPNPIIHRDIKPANVILTPHGTIKLVDFGLVKLLDPNSPMTASGMRGMGTPQYAPPEQFTAVGHTDARSDLFSLGAMLYHLLTGTPPSDAYQRLVSPKALAPPRQINSAISSGTNAAILRAIELRPERRYQTALEMRSFLSGQPVPAQGVNKKVPVAWAAGILTLTVLIVAAAVSVALLQSRAHPAAVPAAPASARPLGAVETPVPSAAGPAAIASVATVTHTATPSPSPTSTMTPTPTPAAPSTGLAWATTADDLFVWDPVSSETRQLDKLAYSSQWEWAPDGKHIAYQRDDGSLMVATLSGDGWQIGSSADFDWSLDGKLLAYLNRAEDMCILHVVKPDGTDDQVIADLTAPASDMGGMGAGGPQDLVMAFITSKRPFDSSADNWMWWTNDGQHIAVQPGFLGTCTAAMVAVNGNITLCDNGWCDSETQTTAQPPNIGGNSAIILQDEDDALWRFEYPGINIEYESGTVSNQDLVLDPVARSQMPNWGFHNNFWLVEAVGVTRRLTERDSFKWLGAWSSDGVWLVYADLTVSEGVVHGEFFDARHAVDIWLLQPQSSRSMQLTDHGMVNTFAWQPLAPNSAASLLADSAQGTRPEPHGVVTAPELSAVLDGRFDEWSGSWQPVIAVVQGAEQRVDVTDSDARFRVAWDMEGLYLALQVTDDAYFPAVTDIGIRTGDGVEITFDSDLSADFDDVHSSSDDSLIVLSFGPRLSELRANRGLPLGLRGTIDVTGAVVATSRGYDLEVMIPWEALSVEASQLKDDITFGFNLAVHDSDSDDSASQTILSLSPARLIYDNPAQWATLRLVAEQDSSASDTQVATIGASD